MLPPHPSFRFHPATLHGRPQILRNKPRLVTPFYDGYVYIWFYLVLRTVIHCNTNREWTPAILCSFYSEVKTVARHCAHNRLPGSEEKSSNPLLFFSCATASSNIRTGYESPTQPQTCAHSTNRKARTLCASRSASNRLRCREASSSLSARDGSRK